MANRPNWNQSGDERETFEGDDIRGLAEDEGGNPQDGLEDDEPFSDEDENGTETETEDQ